MDAEHAVPRPIDAAEARALASALVDILLDAVNGGASVHFLRPLSRDKALAFWLDIAVKVERGERALFAAFQDGRLVGTVQLLLDQPENQPHRAEIGKMMVHGAARRQGLGARLMQTAETAAWSLGKTLLVLDTATGGDAERLYARLGWTRVGVIPDYALDGDGALCGSTWFYKRLAPPVVERLGPISTGDVHAPNR